MGQNNNKKASAEGQIHPQELIESPLYLLVNANETFFIRSCMIAGGACLELDGSTNSWKKSGTPYIVAYGKITSRPLNLYENLHSMFCIMLNRTHNHLNKARNLIPGWIRSVSMNKPEMTRPCPVSSWTAANHLRRLDPRLWEEARSVTIDYTWRHLDTHSQYWDVGGLGKNGSLFISPLEYCDCCRGHDYRKPYPPLYCLSVKRNCDNTVLPYLTFPWKSLLQDQGPVQWCREA